ncbi:GAP family protein [Streptomyces zingiberis]|uniref:GAP family protein n=1 Tax=Streptomyces zingiberis TaxID=2053010 RepID=A0ABX1BVV5_9ACTN|nr:GAP family protein [Streptomyces zingiberis]NJQ00010.1 GAP family protein [Streptomyces zingiberis]
MSTDGLRILPLAVTMMMGPQIMSAIILVTSPRAVRVSLAFLAGVLAATTAGVMVMLGVAGLVGNAVDLGSPSDRGSTGHIVEYVLVGLLALLALRNWLGRKTAEPPKWLGTLMSAGPSRALAIGLLVILLMPSDLVVMLTVGIHIRHGHGNVTDVVPFILLTTLIAALPLLGRLLFHRHAEAATPALRTWMNTHSWLVNILACLIFILLILF